MSNSTTEILRKLSKLNVPAPDKGEFDTPLDMIPSTQPQPDMANLLMNCFKPDAPDNTLIK